MPVATDFLLAVVDFLNTKYGCGYKPDDFFGYFIKPISETEIPFIQGRTSNQYHIAVTAPDKGMRLFPFLASSNYISGELNPVDKGRYALLLKLNLNRQNLIENIEHIIAKIDTANRDWKVQDYSAWLDELGKIQGPRFIQTSSTGTIAVRRDADKKSIKQLQLEIGKSNDPETFLLLRRCMEDGGRLLFLLRKTMDYDIYYFPPSVIEIDEFQEFYIKDFKQIIPVTWGESEQVRGASGLLSDPLSHLSLPKPFVLLAGISGTGKSRFVGEQARACRSGKALKNHCLIPVRPDWHEPADLLGYKSRINGEKYITTDFLRFIVSAWVDATNEEGELRKPEEMTAHWACLDEMNLAPVEQYFADFLSVLETRRYESGVYRCGPLLRASEIRSMEDDARDHLKKHLFDDGIDATRRDNLFDKFANDPTWDGIPIPPNLVVAGTVNMDETTHGFSRKVIDRALTLDFQEFYPNEFGSYLKDDPTKIRTLTFPFAFDSREDSVKAALAGTADPKGERTVAFLESLNASLRETPFELAYRALNEALLSVACFARRTAAGDEEAESQGEGTSSAVVDEEPADAATQSGEAPDELALLAAWDDFLMQKVLPRIEGDGAKLKALREIDQKSIELPVPFGRDTVLHQLYALLAVKLKPIWGEEPEDVYEPTTAKPTRPDLLRLIKEPKAIPCRSRKKLRWMMRRLKANHFTDFWC